MFIPWIRFMRVAPLRSDSKHTDTENQAQDQMPRIANTWVGLVL